MDTMDSAATNRSLRTAALVAGVGILLIAILAGIANFAVVQGLSLTNAAKTAHHILTSKGSMHFAIAALVLAAALDVIVAWGLFEFFAPVSKGLSMLAAWFRVSYAAVFAVAISQLLGALQLLTNSDYLKSFSSAQLNTQALLKVSAFTDIWNVGLVFFGLHLLLIAYLALKSGYVPRVLGVLLAIAGLGYLINSFGTFLVPGYSLNIAAVTFVGEALLMIWLLVKGRSVALAA